MILSDCYQIVAAGSVLTQKKVALFQTMPRQRSVQNRDFYWQLLVQLQPGSSLSPVTNRLLFNDTQYEAGGAEKKEKTSTSMHTAFFYCLHAQKKTGDFYGNRLKLSLVDKSVTVIDP